MNPVIRMVIRFLPCQLNDPVHPDRQVVSAGIGWWIDAKGMAGDLCGEQLTVVALLVAVRFLPGRLGGLGNPDRIGSPSEWMAILLVKFD